MNRYNDFIASQEVKVASNGDREVNLHDLCSKLWTSFLKGRATLTNIETCTINKLINNNNSNIIYSTITNSTTINNYITNNSNVSITRSFFNKDCIDIRSEKYKKPIIERSTEYIIYNHAQFYELIHGKLRSGQFNLQNSGILLSDFDIKRFEFVINSKKLYRVFNQNSFGLGGRFYGAFYQTMPKLLRKDIVIEGEPTVELDYVAHHIRILYHQMGVDYRQDPYLALTEDPEERKVFKTLLLIALNAQTENKAIKGFRNACLTSGKPAKIPLDNASIRGLLQRVREQHAPIAGQINSGVGCKLQNLDSQITEGILMRMTSMGIPCLPVHDSYIVPKQFEERLRDVMTGTYKEVIGFEPVIG